MHDPIAELLAAHFPAESRKTLPSMESVAMDMAGLRRLVMWGARLALLVVMQQFREAEVEMEAFGELVNPDLFYQYHTHNYPDKTGSMVPFSMRLLHAQLPGLTGKPSALPGQTVPATAHLSSRLSVFGGQHVAHFHLNLCVHFVIVQRVEWAVIG
ncbi:Trafficking protein particle complex subunit 12 [Geodia barretti]|nr:Trafficking protein particle complex subunit 12 [Geodia barretti]